MILFNRGETLEKRRLLRRNHTLAERLLWNKLRGKRFQGIKFFRQYGVGSYILDFYCPLLKLAIEADGGQHFQVNGQAYDKVREKYMHSVGIRTIRFTNIEIMRNMAGVLESISERIENSPPPPSLAKRG
jgi:very-short-patch-repair endonuclease